MIQICLSVSKNLKYSVHALDAHIDNIPILLKFRFINEYYHIAAMNREKFLIKKKFICK